MSSFPLVKSNSSYTYSRTPLPSISQMIIVVRNTLNPTISHQLYLCSMCQTAYFESQTCLHYWIVITRPCAPERGFDTCPRFADGLVAKRRLSPFPAPANTCPTCDLGGTFDGSKVRMVSGERRGFECGGNRDVYGGGAVCMCVML